MITERRLSGSRQAGRELRLSKVTTSRVGPMSAYHRILVIGGDRSGVPPVARERTRFAGEVAREVARSAGAAMID
jgi:hypothetical protein